MKKRMLCLLSACLAMILLAGCGAKDVAYLKDIRKIDQYVTLGQYKGLKAEAVKSEITDEYMDMYLEYMLSQLTTYEEVTGRPVQLWDTVNIDFTGFIDGEQFEGGSSEGYDLEIGSNSFISGFEDGLIGANIGDTVILDLAFPDPYNNNPDLSGKPVTFEVKINSISEGIIPELTDELVVSFEIPDVTTAEAFRARLKEEFEADAETVYRQTIKEQLAKAVTDNATVTVPEKMTQRQYDMLIKQLSKLAAEQNMELKNYLLMYYNLTSDNYEEELRKTAEESAKQTLVFRAVADAEGITVTEQDLEDNISYDAKQVGMTPEEYKASLDEASYEEYVLSIKVLDYLMGEAVITEPAELED